MNTTLFSTLSFFLILSLPPASFSERCHPNDKKALLQIAKDLGGSIRNSGAWSPKTDCCTGWGSVECDLTTNRVTSLTFFKSDISAQLPPSLSGLPYLETLMFHHITNLTGPIQPAISKLVNLKMLRLSWTNLSGPIPSFLGQLKNLYFLELNYNQLTGSIPPSLALLPNLIGLRLDRNQLTGKIPEEFGRFPGTAPDLYLSHNQLTGRIPKSLGYLNYTVLDFSRNELVGDVSFLFGTNKTTQIVDFSRNMFEFDISKVEFPSSLTWLDLNHNKISGSLPASLTSLNLQNLNVSYNRLCGQIPAGGKLQDFEIYSYFHNRCLCGTPLPLCK